MKILCMGETLLRYSTRKGERIDDLDFQVHIGGSETNMAVNLAQYQFETALLTKLPDHSLGDAVLAFLRKYNVATKNIIRNDMRIGSYFLERGSGNRTSQVIYDRKQSAMTSFCLDDVDIETLFEGVQVFIVSGITVSLGETVATAVMTFLKYCQDHQITVVYDNNYRAKIWSVEAAGAAFQKILPYVNILSANDLDLKNFLGLKSQEKEFPKQIQDLYQQLKSKYPQLQYITCTKREMISTSVNHLTAYVYDQQLYASPTYVIDDIVDRVGGGDAYLSGLLYGLLHQKGIQYSVDFGCSAAVLKHTICGDINRFSVTEIEDFMHYGNQRIAR